MSKKIFIILLVGFMVQTMLSCICDCPEPKTYEVYFNEVNIKGVDTSGYRISSLQEEVKRNVLGLSVELKYDRLAQNYTPFNFGFSKTMACSCDSESPEFKDVITSIELYITDIEIQQDVNITNSVLIHTNTGEQPFVEEFIEEGNYYIGQSRYPYYFENFSIEPMEYDLFPSKAIFTVEIHLESGEILEASTGIINFID